MLQKRKKLILSVLLLLCACALLFFSDTVRASSVQAMTTAVGTVIPGLFPFMILTEIACQCGLLQSGGKLRNRFLQKTFGFSQNVFPCILFGLTGGYPTGIKTARTLYESGRITQKEAADVCKFCFSPGPAFCIAAVGSGLFASRKTGIFLFAVNTLASLLTGILFSDRRKTENHPAPTLPSVSPALALPVAVRKSADTMFSLCAWITAFAAFLSVATQLLPPRPGNLLSLFAEITAACTRAAEVKSIPLCAAVLQFGGLCITCQLLPDLQQIGVPCRYFVLYRCVGAVFAGLLSKGLLYFFPLNDVQAAAVMFRAYSKNCISSFFLLLACFIFILDLAPAKKTCYTVCGR